MLFTSLDFLVLLIITFFIFYLIKKKVAQILILSLSSFVFYAYNNPSLLILLIVTILINTVVSFFTLNTDDNNKRKIYTTLGVIINLLILCTFKYSKLFAQIFISKNDPVFNFLVTIPLPIGISFFTFQGISLMIDTYKGKLSTAVVKPKILTYLFEITFFKAFFPQLISGPIVKAHDFIPQITVKYFKDIDWKFVFKRLTIGYFLKMVIADNLKSETYWLEFPYFQGFSSFELFILLFGYSIQIFADFAGYSHIAIGFAKLFGYDFPENFNFPYVSKSFSEFWTRWHISLSSFLREYLYFPLGGNRKGKLRTYINLIFKYVIIK